MDYYKQIFKRKSFHLFKDTGTITDAEFKGIEEFIKLVWNTKTMLMKEPCLRI